MRVVATVGVPLSPLAAEAIGHTPTKRCAAVSSRGDETAASLLDRENLDRIGGHTAGLPLRCPATLRQDHHCPPATLQLRRFNGRSMRIAFPSLSSGLASRPSCAVLLKATVVGGMTHKDHAQTSATTWSCAINCSDL